MDIGPIVLWAELVKECPVKTDHKDRGPEGRQVMVGSILREQKAAILR